MARTATLIPTPLPGDVRLMNATAVLFAVVGAVLCAAALLLWAIKQPVFNVRTIRIDGDVTRNSVSTIRANAMPHVAGNFFTVDLVATKRAFEAVPWVRQAIVSRIFPNRLAVRLEEHRAVALWSSETGEDRLVNSFGEVFEANPGDVEDDALPTLEGPQGSSQRLWALWRRLAPAFEPLGVRIETLAMSTRGSLRAELDSAAVVEIGRGTDDELVERTRRFVATVPQVIAQHQRPLVHADLRHNEGYAVRLKGITTTLGPGDKTGRN